MDVSVRDIGYISKEQISASDIPDTNVREWFIKQKQGDSNILEQNVLSDPKSGIYTTTSHLYPSVLEIESTSRCNVNPPCPMCVRVGRTTKDEFDLPHYIVEWLTNPIRFGRSISISGVGEPMMSKDFDYMVSMTNKKARVAFFSNGQVLTDNNLELILSNHVSHIDFSMDAATPETYMKIRGYDLQTFDTVVSNIRRLVDERNKRGLIKPTVHLIMVTMKENYKELPMLVNLAFNIKANGVRYWQMRKPSVADDYHKVTRNGFDFSYEEQSVMPELDIAVKEARVLAKRQGLFFAEN